VTSTKSKIEAARASGVRATARQRLPAWVAVLGASLLLASPGASEERDKFILDASDPPGSADVSSPPPGSGAAVPKQALAPIVYLPPRRGSPERGKVGGGVRGGSKALPHTVALAPETLAYTVSPTPSVFWHVDDSVEGAKVVFSIVDETSFDTLAEVQLASPEQAGIHRVRLADHGIRLTPETEYHWFIAIVPDKAQRDHDHVCSGYLSLIEEPALAGRERNASTYAELGLWYDALESLSDAIDAKPGDAELLAQRSSLLLQGGVDVPVP
jgi:hypothetical protein